MVAVFSLLPRSKTRKNHLARSMSIGKRHFRRRRLPVVHFYRRKISAMFTEGYEKAASRYSRKSTIGYANAPDRTPNLHERLTRRKVARTLDFPTDSRWPGQNLDLQRAVQ